MMLFVPYIVNKVFGLEHVLSGLIMREKTFIIISYLPYIMIGTSGLGHILSVVMIIRCT